MLCCFGYESNNKNVFGYKGVDAYAYHSTLFIVAFLSSIVALCAWLCLVWLFPDPGIINTRADDFDEVN
jgi:hypothetical protein